MHLILATRNQNKVREIAAILEPYHIEVVSLDTYPDLPEVVEDGKTFEENAVKKARTIATLTGEMALADDSGLEVDYLNGAPGVYSARFAGEPKDDVANNRKLLQLLNGVPEEKRTARFRCVMALAEPSGRVQTTEGTCEGVISFEPRGDNGFGYDPLFFVPEFGRTMAQLDLETKNSISHRGRALEKMRPKILRAFGVS
ncbi:MAG: XTP/dITP diphosphatase [Peptococcaceae bacterium]|nr:XTP/dITP diphosphatase [Peptococcaceae bacterium]